MNDDLRVIVDADADPLKRELLGAGTAVRGFGTEVKSQSRGALAFNAALNKQRETLRGVGTFAKTAGFAIGGVLVVGIASAIKTGAEFESQMARVQAVTGATGKEMDQLRKLAIKLGADTKFSANDAAEAMYELSSAGFDVQETQKALPGTLSLAAASSVDLATAAEISSNALRGFGLRSEESTHVSDVLAQSVNSSSVEMDDLQLSLKYIGPVAKATGEGFEEMISAVSLMGDAGIKGEQAGTSLRGGLLRLVKPTKQVKEGLGALGINIEELQGPKGLLPLPQLIGKLQAGLGGLSKAQQAQALAQVFGTEALSGMLTVVDAGPAKLAKLTKEFENSDGASAKAAKTMNDTVKGSFEQLKGSFETVEIELYEHFSEPLKKALLDATHFVNVEGEALQEALDKAMATPEFKESDVAKKAEILADAVGEVWKDSGLQDDITEGLITAFNYALPKVAEAAGKGSLVVAQSFAEGFMKSDVLGRLVIGAWLFTKLGGFAALKAAGIKAGSEVGAGMAVGMDSGVARSAAGSVIIGRGPQSWRRENVVAAQTRGRYGAGATGPSAASSATTGIPGTDSASGLKNGMAWGKSFLKGFGASMLIGGGIAGALAPADSAIHHVQNVLSGATFGLVPEAGPSLGSQLATGAAEAFDEQLGPAIAKSLKRKSTEGLEDLQQGLRDMIQTAIQNGASDADLKPLRDRLGAVTATVDLRADFGDNLDKLRSGVVTRMADIKKVVQSNTRDIDQTWVKGGSAWRTATAQNMQAAIGAIKAGMQQSVIPIKAGQAQIAKLLHETHLVQGDDPFHIAEGFAKSWKKAGDVNSNQIKGMLVDLRKMPPAAREIAQTTMLAMAQKMESEGKLAKGAVSRLRSSLVTSFGQTKTESLAEWVALVKGVGLGASSLNDVVGAGIGAMAKNVNSALEGFGVSKKFAFSLATVGKVAAAEGAAILGIGRQEGGIVPGIGDGDKVHRFVRPDTFILNREATAAHGFRDGGLVPVMLEPGEREFTPEEVKKIGRGRLEAMNEAVPRFQEGGTVRLKKGGSAGVKKEQVAGPEPLRTLGQAGLDQVLAAAMAYVDKHRPKGGVGGTAYGPKGIGTYKGVSMANWVIQALQHAAGKGVDPQPTSGYRSHAQNVSEGRDYTSEHEFDQYPRGAVDFGGMVDPASLPAKMAVVNATKDFKYPLLAPIGFRDDGHASGTGHQLGGFIQMLAEGGFAKGTYTVKGATASSAQMHVAAEIMKAADDTTANHLARVAAMMAATQENDVSGSNTFQLTGPFKGVTPSSSTYDQAVHWFKDGYYEGSGIGLSKTETDPGVIAQMVEGSAHPTLYEQWKSEGQHWADGWDGAGSSSSSAAKKVPAAVSGKYVKHPKGSTSAGGGTYAEDEKGKYKALTGALSFGSLPDTIEGCRKELHELRPPRKLSEYKAAVKHAKDPETKRALEANVKAIEQRIQALIKQQARLVQKKQRERVIGKIAKRAEFSDLTDLLNRKSKAYDEADQFASQVVALEPENLTGDYIGRESSAYGAVLEAEAGWRNSILGAEETVTSTITAMERQIEKIEALRGAKPEAWKKQKYRIPELKKAIGEARGFWWADKHTGSFEESLTNVQGTGGPHNPISPLPSIPEAGTFGGLIFDTQNTIRQLGLKTESAPDTSGWTAAKEAIALQDKQNLALSQGETRVFGDFFRELGLHVPYLGAYMQGTGGMRIGKSGLAMLHRDERVTPDPKGPASSQLAAPTGASASSPQVTLVLRDKAGALVELVDARVDGKMAKVDTYLGAEGRRRASAPGR
ncbi:MAG TPA: phage tail tape measure protein [Solirubrobacterales bacterium]